MGGYDDNSQASNQASETAPVQWVSRDSTYVVCLGASAGGLEALEKFFDNLHEASHVAFVVVQHLSPDFRSLMDELLARHTRLPIKRVTDGMELEPGSIYLIPPKKEMIVAAGKLLLTDKDPSQGLSLPIDTFMRSLAQEYGPRAIGVILSGTGSDGSRGILAIHNAGGFVVAQDEQSADFDGMPRSAVDTGIVDAILPPQLIPHAILERINHGANESVPVTSLSEQGIEELFVALKKAYGIDFSHYKPNTVARRVERRLQLSGAVDLNDYVQQVLLDAEELNALYRDLLIGVTKFFRDNEAYRQIESHVLPQLLENENSKFGLRVWVAGCATGEEAYSLAMLFHEGLTARGKTATNIKIFATDVHQASLDFASAGIYKSEALSEVSPERLTTYFTKHGTNYQVSPELRKMIVFAHHNIVKDAPFTKLDLVSCRNLLIYLQPDAQTKAISLFHFGLRTGGFLFLGPSESTGDLLDEFETIDRHWKVFRKRRDVRLPATFRLPLSPGLERFRTLSRQPSRPNSPDVHLLKAYDTLLDSYVPPCLLVDEHRKLLHSFAGAGKYLKVPDGRLPEDILEYVDPDLKPALAGALQRAYQSKAPVQYGSLHLRSQSDEQSIRLSIKPVGIQATGETFYLVLFEPQARQPATLLPDEELNFDEASRDRLDEVEEELRYTKENLQATVEEMETTNEELQATNEELVASNEELQSTNEELHSVNEELYTVNGEHQRKITELIELTDDMDNLLRSTDVGTIFLDRELHIRKFTPQISRAFQIVPQDIGRPLSAFAYNLRHETLLADTQKVLETESPMEAEVQDRRGDWFLLRILPYRSKDGVDGVVITLIDIHHVKESQNQLRLLSKVFMDGADPIIIEDLDGKIININAEAEQAYGWTRDELLGKRVTLLVPDDLAEGAIELRRRCRSGEPVRNVETWRRDRLGEHHPVLLTLSLLTGENNEPLGIATMAKDISVQRAAQQEALRAVRRRDEFLAMLSHELRNPLGAVSNATKLLTYQQSDLDAVRSASDVIQRQTRRMARLLDDLLDVSRITQGKININREMVELAPLIEESIEAINPDLQARNHQLELQIDSRPVWVEGDPARLLQILENLLTNAAKYTPDGGRIHVGLRHENDLAVLTVRDNGIGITPDLQDSIFELFVQGENQLDRSNGGMGVGLSLVKMLVDLHNGRIEVSSEGSGKGSEFRVLLPLTDQSPVTRELATPSPERRKLRILIVEDNDDSRTTLANLLRLEGHEVSVATDGPSGLEELRRGSSVVALVDIGLPGLNGYELARAARTEITDRALRLVALTGYGSEADRQRVREAGFDAHLVKPVSIENLISVL